MKNEYMFRYHDFPDFERYIRDAARRYPAIAQLKTIGTSREGRSLLGLKVAFVFRDGILNPAAS